MTEDDFDKLEKLARFPARKSDILITFTFGTQEEQIKMYDSSISAEHAGLKAGGTAHTWNLCNSDKKYHINLNRI